MMKNNIKIVFGFALAGLFFSCEDATDIRQPGVLDASAAIQNVDDMQDALINAYTGMFVTAEIHFTSVFTDEIRIGYDTGGQGQSLYRFNLASNNAGPENVWRNNYSGIRRANLVIAAAATIDATGDEVLRDNLLGQAHAIRAWQHLQLASLYIVDMADETSLGVPVVDFVTGTSYTALRNTTKETFDLIYDDLDLAISLITETNNVFFTKDAARALKTRAAAYREDYTTAVPLAQSLLNTYPLAGTAAYEDVFEDNSDAEVIMKLERTINDAFDGQGSTGVSANGGWAGAKYAFTGPGTNGSPYYEVATALYNSFDANDVRRNVNAEAFLSFPAANRDVFTVNKYRGSEGQPLMNDHKILRSSEMALILAEARAQASDPAGAAGFVDQIRDARFGSDQATPSYGSQTEAFGGILDERRLEFAFEGHRYKDLRRLGSKGNRTVDRAAEDCTEFGACELPIIDHRFTWPLPLEEFNGNPALRDQQNPGY